MKRLFIFLFLMSFLAGIADADYGTRKSIYGRWSDEGKLTYSRHGIRVCIDNEDGRFTEGLTTGERLLFGFPGEGSTSHTNFRVDGVIYSNYNWITGATYVTCSAAPHIVDTSVVCSWDITGVRIEQVLTPIEIIPGLGTLFIEYYCTPTDGRSHTVGILLELDTMIDDNDAAPLSTAFGYAEAPGSSGREQEFRAPYMPNYWQAFEVGPDQPPEYLVGQGILYGWGATMPDRFCVGSWPTYVDVAWDYTADTLHNTYWDSAVLLWWYPVTIAPGDTFRVGTYYGLGDPTVSIGELTLSWNLPGGLDFEDCNYSPNPIELTVNVQNVGDTTVFNTYCTLHLPDMMSVAADDTIRFTTPSTLDTNETGTVSWTIDVEPYPNDTVVCVSVIAHADTADSNLIFRCIELPAWNLDPPTASIITPLPDSITSCADHTIEILITDENDIETSSIEMTVDGIVYTWGAPELAYDPAMHRISFTPSAGHYYSDGSTVDVCLDHCEDVYCNDIVEPLCWSFIADLSGPYVDWFSPPEGFMTTDAQTDVAFHLTDDVSDVNFGSVVFTINDSMLSIYSDGVYLIDDTIIFIPESIGVDFSSVETVWVQVIRAEDMPFYCDPNPLQEAPFSWYFIVADNDTTGPFFDNFAPTLWPADSEFYIACDIWDTSGVYDDNTGLEGQGVVLIWDIDGELDMDHLGELQMDSIPGAGSFGSRFQTITPVPPQAEGVDFIYRVRAFDDDSDLGAEDRHMSWSDDRRVLIYNVVGPEYRLLVPYDSAYTSCPRQEIDIWLFDENGVDTSTVSLTLNGVSYSITSDELSYYPEESLLVFMPSSNLPYGENVVTLEPVADTIGNFSPGDTWSFFVDTRPPTMSNNLPAQGAVIDALHPIISFSIADELSGLVDSSIVVTVKGRSFSIGDYGVSFDEVSGTVVINTQEAGLSFRDGEFVTIDVFAYDAVDPLFCPPNELHTGWSFQMSLIPCRESPNPITPNNDGINDYASFKFPNMRQKLTSTRIYIYDIRGKLVRTIEASDVVGDDWLWDGRDESNRLCRQGLYLYVIEVDGEKVCNGTISIAR